MSCNIVMVIGNRQSVSIALWIKREHERFKGKAKELLPRLEVLKGSSVLYVIYTVHEYFEYLPFTIIHFAVPFNIDP